MKSFEERKEEYLIKVRNNVEFLEDISEKNPEMLEMLIMPNTEKELELCNSIFDFFSDFASILEDMAYNNMKETDIENNDFIKIYVELINALKANDNSIIEEFKNKFNKDMSNPTFAANYLYNLIILFTGYPEEAMEVIANKVGLDIDNEVDLLKLKVYLNKFRKFNDNVSNSTQVESLDPNNEEQIKFFNELVKEFHKIYISNIKTDEDIKKR